MNSNYEVLCYSLEYVYNNISCDIIHISAGVVLLEDGKLKRIVNDLSNKKIVIVSAFNNEGIISYPAAFENVIGIDINYNYKNKEDYDIVYNSVIDIRATSAYFRVKWVNPESIIINGSSFSAAYFTGVIAEMLSNKSLNKNEIINILSKSAKNIYRSNAKKVKQNILKVEKAIVLPFNKEIHPIAANEDLLDINIIDYYDFDKSMNIAKKIIDNFINEEKSLLVLSLKKNQLLNISGNWMQSINSYEHLAECLSRSSKKFYIDINNNDNIDNLYPKRTFLNVDYFG